MPKTSGVPAAGAPAPGSSRPPAPGSPPVTPPVAAAPPRPAHRLLFGQPAKLERYRIAGRACSPHSPGTCSMRPARSTTILSASVIASTWSCVT